MNKNLTLEGADFGIEKVFISSFFVLSKIIKGGFGEFIVDLGVEWDEKEVPEKRKEIKREFLAQKKSWIALNQVTLAEGEENELQVDGVWVLVTL